MEQTTDHFTALRDHFLAAMEQDGLEAQLHYVAHNCPSEPKLRDQLVAMLKAHQHSGAFLLSEPTQDQIGASNGDFTRTRVGPYKIRELLGEGGMGSVYLAEQERPVRRKVALKIVKPGLDTRQVIARFEAERQALAMMDHPNIARVFDGGSMDNGRPYFVMELVRGMPITEYSDRERLPLHRRLDLFVVVCRAVHHAHQKGIIHRDIKPSNILVTMIDGLPVPKIIDFGIAKATGASLTDNTVYTRFNQLVGTPAYMSPEQAALSGVDIDTRSDIYSLGVVLYELLTGTTPIQRRTLENAAFDEIRRIIQEEEPPRPSLRLSTLLADELSTVSENRQDNPRHLELSMRRELDWIVLKALDKDRQRRYSSASAFAEDVLRYLADERVEACPPSRRYQLTKFLHRNRAALLTTTALIITLVIGLGISTWQAIRATNAEQGKDLALAEARLAVDEMYTQVAEKWLSESGSLTDLQREFLEKALAFYERLARVADSDPEAQYAALRSLERVARIYQRQGKSAAAAETLLDVLNRASELSARYPGRDDFRVELVSARVELARNYDRAGQPQQALDLLELAVGEITKLAPPAESDALANVRLAIVLGALSQALVVAGRLDDAETSIQRALDSWHLLVRNEPNNFDLRFGLADAYHEMGRRHMYWGFKNDKAERPFREADTLLTALLSERPGEVRCRRVLRNTLTLMGNVLGEYQRYGECIAIRRRCVSIAESLADDFPNDPDDQDGFGISLTNLASTLSKAGTDDFEAEILQLRTDAFAVTEKLVQQYPTELGYRISYVQLARMLALHLLERGRYQELNRLFERAISKIREFGELSGSNRELAGHVAYYIIDVSAAFVDQGDHVSAAKVLADYPEVASRYESDVPGGPKAQRNPVAAKMQEDAVQVTYLLLTTELFGRCIELANNDSALSHEQRSATAGHYEARASLFRQQADLALDGWTRRILDQKDLSAVEAWAEKCIGDFLASKARAANASNGLKMSAHRTMFQGLMTRAAVELEGSRFYYFVAFQIASAPSELRDVDLALRVAQSALAESPQAGDSHLEALGWALYRADKWQACIDAIESEREPDPSNPASIYTMALWQLGRQDEARALFEKAPEKWKAYMALWQEKQKQKYQLIPTQRMMQRLYEEASQLLARQSQMKTVAAE